MNAITNVQLKPNSGHDPKILRGIFTGLLHCALTVCSQKHQQEEIDFLVQNFVDNGYQKHKIIWILKEFQRKRSNPPPTPSKNTEPTQIVVFPEYLGYLQNCGSHLEMQDIRLFSKAFQT